jgi:undecaprenyl-diphosphatase
MFKDYACDTTGPTRDGVGGGCDVEDERARPADEDVKGELNQDRFLGDRDLTRWQNRVGRSVVAAVQLISGKLGAHAALLLIL